ncbi:DUF2463 domain-containing protein [Encephalitozoon intestinalis]|nr:DUF2463 domain-containing protein [Encephalitozoon intestinalis]
MKAISISETANLVLSRTDREKTKPKRNCIYGIHNNLSTPIFIFISMSVYFFLRNKIFKNNLLLRLILFILPLSSFLLPFLLLIIYLLSTACSLAPGSFSFIDSGFDSLLNLLLLACSLVYLMIILRGEKFLSIPQLSLLFLSYLDHSRRDTNHLQEA